MSLKTVYHLTISTLTPVHIGNGETLELNLDYAVFDRRTWVIDHDAFGREKLLDRNGRLRQDWAQTPPGRLLAEQDFRPNSNLFRYVLPGTPRAGRTGAQLQTHIKDVHDRPYLPGSSLKGALRTLLFRHAFQEKKSKLTPAQLNRSRSWAAQRVERDHLGQDPNHDLLRALHIADTEALPAAGSLVVANAQVFGSSSMDAPIALEVLKGDVVFHSTLTIDDYLFENENAQKTLQFGNKRDWLANLPAIANVQAAERIRREIDAYHRLNPSSRALGFYNQLESILEKLGPNRFLLQVGWGGGWDSKTLGYLIPQPDLATIVGNYKLDRGHRSPHFPKTRRAVARGAGANAEPAAPFGWLLVEMEEQTT